MTWTHLLPEPGTEPAGFVDPLGGPRRPIGWHGQPPPADPATVTLDEAMAFAAAAVYSRQPGAEQIVRAWPAGFRRLVALRMHIDAARNAGSPDEGPARLMPVLIDDRIRWTRSELAWALRTADDWCQFDGGAFLLPGYIAAALSAADLAGFGPALRAVFDTFIEERDTPRPVRRLLAELYGRAIGRLAGRLPLHLLPWSDPFGRFARERLGARLDEPGVAGLLEHAASLSKPVPAKRWLSAAEAFPAGWPVWALLECFVAHDGHAGQASDDLLRGLAWMLSLDPSGAATGLLALAAARAAASDADSPRYPFAPQTAAAAVEILAARPGDVPACTLRGLAETVRNRALRARVDAALARLPTVPA
jgi:hypothetical protein